MKSAFFTLLVLSLCSQRTLFGAPSRLNQQQTDKIAYITTFTQELVEFLKCVSAKITTWQKRCGTEKWVTLGQPGHEQWCQVESWTYGKNGVHVLRGTTHDFAFEHELDINEHGSPEFSSETSLNEKKNQILLTLTLKQIPNELTKIIGWYQPNPNDLHEKEINALNNLKGVLRIFVSAFKKEFKDEPLVEHEIINTFLALKLPSKRNRTALVCLAAAGSVLTAGVVITMYKLYTSNHNQLTSTNGKT